MCVLFKYSQMKFFDDKKSIFRTIVATFSYERFFCETIDFQNKFRFFLNIDGNKEETEAGLKEYVKGKQFQERIRVYGRHILLECHCDGNTSFHVHFPEHDVNDGRDYGYEFEKLMEDVPQVFRGAFDCFVNGSESTHAISMPMCIQPGRRKPFGAVFGVLTEEMFYDCLVTTPLLSSDTSLKCHETKGVKRPNTVRDDDSSDAKRSDNSASNVYDSAIKTWSREHSEKLIKWINRKVKFEK